MEENNESQQRSEDRITSPKDILSLEEMYTIFFHDEAYAHLRQENGTTKPPSSYRGYELPINLTVYDMEEPAYNLLFSHIYAEQLLHHGVDEIINMEPLIFHPNVLLNAVELWMHPLYWKTNTTYKNMVVDGRIAVEGYYQNRRDNILALVNSIHACMVIRFVEELLATEADDSNKGKVEGLHQWDDMTTNYEVPLMKVLSGEHLSRNDVYEEAHYLDASILRASLCIIEEYFSPEVAAKTLRLLQSEWPQLKLWDEQLKYLPIEEINRFDEYLRNGFDDLLNEWENTNEESFDDEEETGMVSIESILFTKKARNEKNEATIVSELKRSMIYRSDTTKALVEELKSWQKEDYIKVLNAKKMYTELYKLIDLPFVYDTFRKYYNNIRN